MEEALATIELRLIPKEDRAEPLLKNAKAVVSKLRFHEPVCRTELKNAQEELLKESTSYLEYEWEIVKKGEPWHRWAVGITKGLVAVWIVVFLGALVDWTVGHLVTDTAGANAPQVEEMPARGNAAAMQGVPEVGEPVADAKRAPGPDAGGAVTERAGKCRRMGRTRRRRGWGRHLCRRPGRREKRRRTFRTTVDVTGAHRDRQLAVEMLSG